MLPRHHLPVANKLTVAGLSMLPGILHHTLPCSDQVDDAGIVLSLESRSSEALAAACERLKGLLPAGALLSEHRDSSAINSPAVGGGANGGLGPAAS